MEVDAEECRCEIMAKVRKFIQDNLIDAKEWPANREATEKFYRMCEEHKLEETLPDEGPPAWAVPFASVMPPEAKGIKAMPVYKFTELGMACKVHIAAYLIGAHSMFEIPVMLAAVGLLELSEVDEFYRRHMDDRDEDDDELAAVQAVKELALKAYYRCEELRIETEGDKTQ